MKCVLILLTSFLALSLANNNRLENALNQLKIAPRKKLTDHFEHLQSKAMLVTDDCYNTTLTIHGDQTNVFEEDLRDVVQKYFKAFSEPLVGLSDEKYAERVSILIDSLADYVEGIYKCENDKLKNEGEQQQRCLTSVSYLSPAELSVISGSNMHFEPESHIKPPYSKLCSPELIPGEKAAPVAHNWNTTGFVSLPAKRQGECDSCFIFAPVGAAESAYYRFKGKRDPNVRFSEQAILNCMYEGKPPKDDACTAGGLPGQVFNHMLSNGLVLEKDEPYVAKTGHCKLNYSVVATPLSYCNLKDLNDATLKRQLFRNGPLSVHIDATGLSQICPQAAYTGPCNANQMHSVLLVGYDEKYWYFKNSWGATWNGDGFFKMPRNSTISKNCKLYNFSFVPLFKL